jgi:hypothetical protein
VIDAGLLISTATGTFPPVSDIDTAVVDSLKVLDLKWPIREADNGGFWPAMVCPLMTQQRHWLCTAVMVLMPVSTPIKVLV